jgi:Aspartyl protease
MNGLCRVIEKSGRRRARQAFRQPAPMHRIACLSAALCLALAASALRAQQPAANTPQQPDTGAQVHTGVTSGLDTETRLDNLLADHQFLRVQSQLDQLPPRTAQFYRGILANRDNDLKKSIELLQPLVDEVTASGNTGVPADRSSSAGWNTAHENLLRKALAEDYLREGDWAKAADAYQALATRLDGKLGRDEQDEIEMPLKMLPLAKDNPPMTVDPCDPFELQVSKNLLGLIDIPVFVDARPHSWMLDPTAPFNLIARSLATEAGLTVSTDAVTIHSLTGHPIQVHMTVIPRFTIGGQLTLRNMTAFVFEDADYFFPQTHYQVEGVLGYPALQALGSLTVTDNDTIYVDPGKQISAAEKSDEPAGVRFFLDGDQILVPLGSTSGQQRMFAIDAGGQQTYLTSRYYDEHANDFTGQKMQLFAPRGQSNPVPAFNAETIALQAGPTKFNVHFIPVLTQPLGSAALDDIYGVLGVDALDPLGSYTFDYRTMRFSITLNQPRD